jgi:hypothetical protein
MSKITLTDGSPVTPDHHDINPATGMQKGYVVLSEDERAKGFVESVRDAYVHIGPPAPANLRNLTDEEVERLSQYGYIKFEAYGAEKEPISGRYWTQPELDRLGGCGATTTMHRSLAETYARNPEFYSGTFCSTCRDHFPVGENGEFLWLGTSQRVGTRSPEQAS